MDKEKESNPNTDSILSKLSQLSILADNDKDRLKSWLGKILKVIITDGRCIVGRFVCTDNEGNTILENAWEYLDAIEDSNDCRYLGLALVPGKHMMKISVMKNI